MHPNTTANEIRKRSKVPGIKRHSYASAICMLRMRGKAPQYSTVESIQIGQIDSGTVLRVWIAMNELHLPHRQREASNSTVATVPLDAVGALIDFTPSFATVALLMRNRSLELSVVTVRRVQASPVAGTKTGITPVNADSLLTRGGSPVEVM